MHNRRVRRLIHQLAVLAAVGSLGLGMTTPVPAAETAPAAETVTTAESPAPPVGADPAIVTTNGTEGWPKAEDIASEAGIVMDASSGAILYAKNMDQQMYPASLTKIMTTLLALENGNLDDVVTMTQTGVNYAVGGSSNLNTQVGEQFVLRDMLYGVMLKSANDISTQVGEHLGGGSIDRFSEMMNERARELGCTNTNFHNACGMPDPEHVTTARDLALIGRACIEREDFRQIIGTMSYEIPATNLSPARTVTNHVAMFASPEYRYPGILGGKTGLTDAAGSCLITFVERDGRTLISVTLKGADGGTEVNDQKHLYDYAFANFENLSIWDRPEEVLSGGVVTVPNGVTKEELTASETEGSTPDGTKTVSSLYTYNGATVGYVTVSEQDLEAEADTGSSVVPTAEGKMEAAPEAESDGVLGRVYAMSLLRKIIVGMSALIILGIAAIIVTLFVKRER